jgi:hypothetical protein
LANINTSASVTESPETPLKAGKKSASQLNAELALGVKEALAGKMVEVRIPKALAGKIGDPFYLDVNGVTVGVKVDGQPYKVPEIHANRIMEIINAIE